MSCPITKECSNLNEEHLAYLHSLTTPEAIVWGNEDGTRNGHAYCLMIIFMASHGRTAKALDEKLKVREFRKSSSILEHIFDCGNCNQRIKEHAICRYHMVFVQLSKKKTLPILTETQAAIAYSDNIKKVTL